jgi:hypothetical protein
MFTKQLDDNSEMLQVETPMVVLCGLGTFV